MTIVSPARSSAGSSGDDGGTDGGPEAQAGTARLRRGPYRRGKARRVGDQGRPSHVLAENVRTYRALQQLTQDELAARMSHLGHGWGRSTVSAVEGKGRNVTIDELFGLALSIGVTVGDLLDPTGPGHNRQLSLDVGLPLHEGGPRALSPTLAQLWAASRAVVRFWHDDGEQPEFDVAADLPVATARPRPRRPRGRRPPAGTRRGSSWCRRAHACAGPGPG
jgi:transcriptional regulator with XRE-family HTH domain